MRPGYKSTEYWATVVTQVLGALMASGVVAPESTWGTVVGAAMTLVASLGYGYFRTSLKKEEAA